MALQATGPVNGFGGSPPIAGGGIGPFCVPFDARLPWAGAASPGRSGREFGEEDAFVWPAGVPAKLGRRGDGPEKEGTG